MPPEARMTQESAINQLSDRLNELSARLKSREHSATVLEGACAQMFNALFGWKLVNLNQVQGNFPGVDLGDDTHRIAIQMTVHDQSEKAAHTIAKIESAKLRGRFDCFLCFFLVPKAPGSRTPDPADFHRWGIRDLIEGILKPLQVPVWLEPHVPSTHHVTTLERLLAGIRVVEETLGRMPPAGPKPNNLPFGRNSHFGQRQEEMAKLQAALEQEGGVAALTQPQVVHGLGGVGKTQLAIQYAWEHAENFSALLWLPADSESSIATGLARLCEVLDLPEKEEREDSVRAEAVRRRLRTNSGWLLIADNADTPEAQTALLREIRDWHHGRIIITSRLEDWSLQSAPIPLGTWTDMQGAQWLLARLADKPIVCPETDACALIRELGGLPLALEQAAAYMEQRRIGPAEYLNRFRASAETARKLLATAMPHGGGTAYEATVATTWLVTVDQLTPVARAILKMIAWLGPDEIPRFLFIRAPDQVLKAAAEGFASEVTFASASHASANPTEAVEESLALLARYSLIELREDHLTCHRLVQSTQRWVEPQVWLRRTIRWVNSCVPSDPPPDDVRSWPRTWNLLQKPLEGLIRHESTPAYRIGLAIAAETNWSRLLTEFGNFFIGKADHQAAEPLYRRALEIDELSFGPRDPRVATDLNNLASLFQETNRLAEAEPMYRRALQIDETHFGSGHPRVASHLNNLAQLLRLTDRLPEAESLMRRALEIDIASFGRQHPQVAIRLNNLAQLLHDKHRLVEAELLMREALTIDEASFGPVHPHVSRDLNNLAQLFIATNRRTEAEPLLRRGLQIEQVSKGEEHPHVATLLNNLATLLKSLNRLEEAEPMYRRALPIEEARFGAGHPNVAINLNNLAQLLQDTNRAAEAEPLMRRALEIDEASFGLAHTRVARDLNNLAFLLQTTGRRGEAEPLMRRALRICSQSLEITHPHTQATLGNYRQLLASQKLSQEDIEKRVQEVLAEAEKK